MAGKVLAVVNMDIEHKDRLTYAINMGGDTLYFAEGGGFPIEYPLHAHFDMNTATEIDLSYSIGAREGEGGLVDLEMDKILAFIKGAPPASRPPANKYFKLVNEWKPVGSAVRRA